FSSTISIYSVLGPLDNLISIAFYIALTIRAITIRTYIISKKNIELLLLELLDFLVEIYSA
ncbi:hypothetical protein N7516_009625, partial [Penicillium verrucosum]|uniref:uncharacterized protein n=1 Tax=Penicillium verrucosum TaxID=60171 RepID=UPI002545840A